MTTDPGKPNGTGRGKARIRSAIDAAAPAAPSKPPADASPWQKAVPRYLSSRFEMKDSGLYKKSDKDDSAMWICGPFSIEAETRDEDGRNWGLLIAWRDRDGVRHEESFPRNLFSGECGELRSRLADAGLTLNAFAPARQAFAEYLNVAASSERARGVARVGWHHIGVHRAFVLPERVFGAAGERVVLQTPEAGTSVFKSAGTLDSWRSTVSRMCIDNSRLTFAASCAFGAPLLDLLGEEGGGFHLRGASRLGKSTALRVAASVCGGSPANGAGGFIRQWRATSSGLEGVAASHCDSLLPLDELGQVDAREASETAYMLGNGAGKIRSVQRGGAARPTLRFKMIFLSTGEVSLSDKNAEAGKATKAGQEVRLADLPADAGAGFGIFEYLHDHAGGDEFSREIREVTTANYGTALPAYLEVLVARLAAGDDAFITDLRERIARLLTAWLQAVPGAGGQVRSVGYRFALVGIAGELAAEALITEWPAGWASTAAERCFRAWLGERGTPGAREDAQAVAQLRGFIAKHGSSRFETWIEPTPNPSAQTETDSDQPPPERFRVQHRAGWKRWTGKGPEHRARWTFLFTSEGLHEALAGLGFRDAVKTLADLGHIVPSKGAADLKLKVTAAAYQVPGHGKVRLYEIAENLLAGMEGEP